MAQVPELVGELVRLRQIVASDAERAWELVQDPETRRVTGTTEEFAREEIERWTASVADLPGRYDFAITSAVTRDDEYVSEEMLGEIILYDIDEQAGSVNLRLNMLTNYRGRGYGRDAIDEVLRFAFAAAPDGLGLNRVQLDVLSINPRAQMLYESLGFVTEGRLRSAHRDETGFCDVVIMSILVSEYAHADFHLGEREPVQ